MPDIFVCIQLGKGGRDAIASVAFHVMALRSGAYTLAPSGCYAATRQLAGSGPAVRHHLPYADDTICFAVLIVGRFAHGAVAFWE